MHPSVATHAEQHSSVLFMPFSRRKLWPPLFMPREIVHVPEGGGLGLGLGLGLGDGVGTGVGGEGDGAGLYEVVVTISKQKSSSPSLCATNVEVVCAIATGISGLTQKSNSPEKTPGASGQPRGFHCK